MSMTYVDQIQTFSRYCLLCTSSKWSNLNQMGFDILSNISSDLFLEENSSESCVTEVLLSTLTTCISSVDRFQVFLFATGLIESAKRQLNFKLDGGSIVINIGCTQRMPTHLS